MSSTLLLSLNSEPSIPVSSNDFPIFRLPVLHNHRSEFLQPWRLQQVWIFIQEFSSNFHLFFSGQFWTKALLHNVYCVLFFQRHEALVQICFSKQFAVILAFLWCCCVNRIAFHGSFMSNGMLKINLKLCKRDRIKYFRLWEFYF